MAGSGVKKVNEHIVKEGRALIVTELVEMGEEWDNIPNGTLYADKATGNLFVKVEGHDEWQPIANAKAGEEVEAKLAATELKLAEAELNINILVSVISGV